MSTASNKIEKDVISKGESIQAASSANIVSTNAVQTVGSKNKLISEKIMKLLYRYAEEAILKEIELGSKAFKNYLKNRLTRHNISDNDIEIGIQNAEYSQLKERYFKDGKLIAKESQKYTLTSHAKERISKPNLENVTPLFKKYSQMAKKKGIKGDKQCLDYLKEKIQPRDIQLKAVLDAVDNGKCQKLTGKRLKYKKDDLTVIVSKHDHSIITVYRDSITTKKKEEFKPVTCSLNNNGSIPATSNQTVVSENCKINDNSTNFKL